MSDAPGPTAPLLETADVPVRAPGQTVDRYLVLRSIGAGGCGEVLSAFDPVLDRNVAIKILRGDGGRAAALLREARTLAKMNHPNIVAIYDAGVTQEHPFLAMELVTGSDLHGWLRSEEPREPGDVLTMVLRAGEGLAAAHEAGIVHGDIKPANILIGDGRALVTDFGVAVWDAGAQEAETDDDEPRLVGTPAYMAPEQYRGTQADARSDQFAFCQTAWEALFGDAAYRAQTSVEFTDEAAPDPQVSIPSHRRITSAAELASLEAAKLAGPPEAPESVHPQRVAKALRRGLSADPAERWPSMEALLAVLRDDPWRRKRWWYLGSGALGLTLLASAMTALWLAPEPPCQGAAAALGELAGPRLNAMDQALQGGNPAYDAARDYASFSIRRYAQGWQAMHSETCEATAIRREQSAEVLDLRMQCLQRARTRLDAATQVLLDDGPAALPGIHRVTAGLPPLSGCADVPALTAEVPPPEDAALREQVEDVQRSLARIEADANAGHQKEALAELGPLVELTRSLEHPPVLAEVLSSHGRLLETMGQYKAAGSALEEAYQVALEHGPTRVAIKAAGDLAYVYSTDLPDLARAEVYGNSAIRLVRRNHADTGLEAAVLTDHSSVLMAQGDIEASDALDRRALDIRQHALGPNHITLAEVLENLAGTAMLRGHYEEAETLGHRALEILTSHLGDQHPTVARSRLGLAQTLHMAGDRTSEVIELLQQVLKAQEAALGSEHPELAWTLLTMGEALDDQARWAEGGAAFERSLALRQAALGADHPDVAASLQALGGHHLQAGDVDEGESMLRQAIETFERTLGAENLALAPMYGNLGSALFLQEKYEQARIPLARALELYERNVGPAHPETRPVHLNLGRIEFETGHWDEALQAYERALGVTEAAHGGEHPDLVRTLLLIGRAHRERGDLETARAAFQRGYAITRAHRDLPPADAGDVAFDLAQVESEPSVAIKLAREARAQFVAAGSHGADDVLAVDAWMSEQPSR